MTQGRDISDSEKGPASLGTTSLPITARLRAKLMRVASWKIRVFKKGLNVWALLTLVLVIAAVVRHIIERRSRHPTVRDENNQLLSTKVIKSKTDEVFLYGCQIPDVTAPRASAAFVMLARNKEIDDVIKSMKLMERHFNQWFNYPWVFLNDEPFTEHFKETVKLYTTSEVEFGVIDQETWNFPNNIDHEVFYEAIESQGDRGIMYGNMELYHRMCRFYSGFFYKHPLVKKRDWYWRVEPDVKFFCDLTYDPFVEMEKRKKKYAFTVMLQELYYTVPGLFKETRAFIRKNGIKVGTSWDLVINDSKNTKGNATADYDGLKSNEEIFERMEEKIALKKVLEQKGKTSDTLNDYDPKLLESLFYRAKNIPDIHEDTMDREDYNLCHFWSNFEIARTDLFNSPIYEKYFKHLEKSGGFYTERWGDAPVHTLGVAMILSKDELHYFRDIGYKHSTLGHCPANAPDGQLDYVPSDTYFDKSPKKYDRFFAPNEPRKNGVGCRCVCPEKFKEMEDNGASCIKDYGRIVGDNYKPLKALDVDYWEKEMEKRMDEYLQKGGQLGKSNIAKELAKLAE